jgi:hypothetical protein
MISIISKVDEKFGPALRGISQGMLLVGGLIFLLYVTVNLFVIDYKAHRGT